MVVILSLPAACARGLQSIVHDVLSLGDKIVQLSSPILARVDTFLFTADTESKQHHREKPWRR